MSDTFKAIVAEEAKKPAVLKDLTLNDLPEGDVLVDVRYSTLNYKDGLAVAAKSPICKSYPMVCGIDLAGVVAESDNPDFPVGTEVIVNGFGLSEKYWGGYSQRQRLKSEWLLKKPEGFTLRETMAIGTAGYTAMLCVMALERHDVIPDKGPVVVTGAGGGVGSVATAILARLGYDVIAVTGRAEIHDYLKGLGAASVMDRAELAGEPKPLGRERWAGAVDSVGSKTLANLLSQTRYGGCVAACGLAGGIDLPVTVFPFILRGVTLAGVDSVMAPIPLRKEAWDRLAQDLPREKLLDIVTEEPLERVPELANDILAGQVRGRVVIRVAD